MLFSPSHAQSSHLNFHAFSLLNGTLLTGVAGFT